MLLLSPSNKENKKFFKLKQKNQRAKTLKLGRDPIIIIKSTYYSTSYMLEFEQWR